MPSSDSIVPADIKTHFDLQPLNTLGCPALAEYFCAVTTLPQLQQALAWAHAQDLPVHLLGGGSNVLCAPFITGLTLAPAFCGRNLIRQDDDYAWVELAAGENWHAAVLWCHQQGWFGLENLGLIPGSAGAAPIQNIGAYGVELADLLDEVVCYNRTSQQVETLDLPACQLSYRDSAFKHQLRHSHIILAIRLRLQLRFTPQNNYPALSFDAPPTAAQLLQRVIDLRQSKLPDPCHLPNVGSFFKNPIIGPAQFTALITQYPNMPHYPAARSHKLAAAWLIEQAGFKGQTVHGITIHRQQALVLTNPEHLPRKNVLACAAAIAKQVQEKFAVELEIEPQLLG